MTTDSQSAHVSAAATSGRRSTRLARLGLAVALLALPALASAQLAAAGDSKVNLSWTNPGGTVQVVVLQSTSTITNVPANGTIYEPFTYNPALANGLGGFGVWVPTAIGTTQIAWVGSGTSVTCPDVPAVVANPATTPPTPTFPGSPLTTNGTTYFFKIFARNAAGVYTQVGPELTARPAAINVTSINTGTGDVAVTLFPSGLETVLDTFAFATNTGTDTVTSLTVTLTPPNAFANIASVRLTTTAGVTVGTPVTPTSNSIVFGGLSLPIGVGPVTYNVRITPKLHLNMPPVPGAQYATQGFVTSYTCTNTKSGADSASSTVTIDNRSPNDAAWGTITPGNATVTLTWNSVPADAARIVILRNTASITDAPTEGVVPGASINTSTVAYNSATVATLTTPVNGLTNGTGYYFKIFVQDAAGNWSAGTETGPILPGTSTSPVGNTINGTKAPVVSIVNPARNARVGSTTGSFKVQVRGFSPDNAGVPVPITRMRVRAYQGAAPATTAADDAALLAKSGTTSSGLWQRTIAGLAPGQWTLDAEAVSTAGTVFSSPITVTVISGVGDGNLLARDNSDQLCSDCHALASHSSETGNVKYGTWAATCRDCHAPHGTRNIFVVSESVTPPPRGAAPATAPKEVAFSTRDQNALLPSDKAANRANASYANTDNTGACQVCHTLTKYYRADGTSPGGTHQTGNRCSDCHPHSAGMAVNCTTCHGTAGRASIAGADVNQAAAPPRGVNNEAATTDRAVGAHAAHVNRATLRSNPLLCSDCHPATGNHDGTGTRDMVFGPLAKGTLSSVALAPNFDGTGCSATWCHGAGLPTGGGSITTPSWTGTNQAACGTCHGMPPTIGHVSNPNCSSVTCHGAGYTTAGISGVALTTHIDGIVQRPGAGSCTGCHGGLNTTPVAGLPGVNAAQILIAPPFDTGGVNNPADPHIAHINKQSQPVACFDCHGNIPVLGDPSHPDGNPFISLSQSVLGNQDSGFAVYAAGTCSSVYCHGGSFPVAARGSSTTPTWVPGTLACGTCHGAPPGDALHASVNPALGVTSCSRCHSLTVTAAGAIIPNGNHVNGFVEMTPTFAQSCADCHGTASRAPLTQAVSHFEAAPPTSLTAASTTYGVGAHITHTNGTRSRNVECETCHDGSKAFEANSPNYATMWTHADGVTDIRWATLAKKNGAAPAYTLASGGSCGTVYCHGTAATPVWTSATRLACNACHGTATTPRPPYTLAGGFHPENDACANCHTGYTVNSVVQVRHVDGNVDVVALTCSTCHSFAVTSPFTATNNSTATTDVRVGAHATHLGAGGLAAALSCSDCHGTIPAAVTHADGQVLLNWSTLATGNGAATAAPTAGNIPTASTPMQCANYCHGGSMTVLEFGGSNKGPNWTLTGQAVCGTCHFSGTVPATSTRHPKNDTNAVAITTNTQCIQCHPDTVTAAGTINLASGKHVNGALDVSGGHIVPFAPVLHSAAFFADQASCAPCHDLAGDPFGKIVNATTTPPKSCDSCHANPAAFGYATATPTTTWTTECTFCHGSTARAADAAFALVGTPTHNLNQVAPPEAVVDGNVSATTVVQVGAHLKHYSTTTSVKVQCTACHGLMPTTLAHADGASPASWSTLVTLGGAAVTPAQGANFAAGWEATPTCTNYCHGATMTGGSKTAPSWIVPADGACGTCHFVANTSAQGTHASHVNNASILGTNFTCNDCHSTVVSTANAITNGALHLNSNEEISMLARGAQSSGTYTVAAGCAANWCHSSGQATPKYQAITWSSGAIGCNGCHGTGNASGAPDYASGTAGGVSSNSHLAHTANGASAASCRDCHINQVNATGTGIVGTLHVNGTRNVSFNTAANVAGPGATYNAGPPKTCSSVACHGGVTVTWGAGASSVKCSDCHTAAADTDSFAFGTAGKINTTEWVQSGHGQPAAIAGGSQIAFGVNAFPTIAASQPCLYCHDPAISHQTAANPFRLNGPVGAAGVVLSGNYNSSLANAGNDVCLNCHGTLSEPGVNPSVGGTPLGLRTAATKVSSRHANHTGGNLGGYRCWDCHDPHGDGNTKMIGKKVVQTSADTNSFSATRVPAGATTVVFTATVASTNRTNFYNATFTGICNVCHTAPTAHFTNATNDAAHMSPQLCTDCHQHQGPSATTAFSPGASHATPYPAAQHAADFFLDRASCTSCHGVNYDTLVGAVPKSCDTCHATLPAFGYTGVANANWKTDCTFCHGSAARAADPEFANSAGPGVRNLVQAAPPEAVTDGVVTGTLVGAHLKHIGTTGALKVQCTTCHGSPIASSLTHIDSVIALGWGTIATLGNTPSPTLFNATWEATATCTNYCHGATMVGGTRMTAARWMTPADGACGACHFTTGATATLTHAAHTNNAAILGTNFACVDCHNSVVSAGGTIVGPTLHVNGGEEVSMGARNGQSNGTYTVAGGCTASYCHSSGTATPTYRGLTWTAPAIGCNGCHGTTNAAGAPDYASGTAGGVSANNHLKHTANGVIAGAVKCQDCHFGFVTATGTAISGTQHVNGTRNVAFNVAVAGASAAYVAGKTCNSVNCHSNGTPLGGTLAFQTPSPVWGGTTTCSSCHAVIGADVGGTATSLSAKHGKHVTTYAYTCDECHAGTAAADSSTAILAGSVLHADANKQVSFSSTLRTGTINQSAGTYAGSGGSCSASYCHSGGVATAAPFSATASAALAWTGTATCRSCHGFDNSAAPTIGVAAGSSFQGSAIHANHVSNAAVIGTNFVCSDCHASMIPTGNGTTANIVTTLHVDGTKTVSFSTRNGQTGGNYTGGSCAANYCHSNGQATPIYRSASWTAPVALGCNGCHGWQVLSAAQNPAGAPDYASGAAASASANSHLAHTGNPPDATSCKDCHFGLVSASSTVNIVVTGTLHANGTRNVVFDTNVAGTGALWNGAVGTKTCTSVACHGAGTPVWGSATGSVTCASCHLTTGNELEDLGASFWSNGIVSTIGRTAWLYSGHGKTTGTYDVTGNAAPAFSTTVSGTTECLYCHDSNVLHGTTTNPFRLRGASTAASGQVFSAYSAATDPNAVCNNCHKTGDFGVDPDGAGAGVLKNGTKNMDAAHDGAKHTIGTLGGKFCWDCHEPHGDRDSNSTAAGQNIAMIRSLVFQITDGTYGYIGASGQQRSVTYNSQAAGAPAAGRIVEQTSGPPRVGLCQACHHSAVLDTTLPAPTAWTKYWNRNGQDDADGPGATAPVVSAHNVGDTGTPYCVSCHPHNQKFKGAGDCVTCHTGIADDPAIPGTRRAIVPEFQQAWSHKRSAGGAVTPYDCIVCHMEGDPATGNVVEPTFHKNGVINLRDPDTGANIKGVTFTAATNGPGSYASTATDATFTQFRRNLSSTTLEPSAQAIMINQCLHCHDADGATSPLAQVPVAQNPSATQYKPFGTTITGSGYSAHFTANGTVGGVTNIKASFATTNATYHPILGAQNNFYAKLTRMLAPWNAGTRGSTANTTTYGWLMTCWDCHSGNAATGLQTYSLTAHGGSVTVRGAVWSTTSPLCKTCHVAFTSGNAHGTESAFNSSVNSGMNTYIQNQCHYCHSSGVTKPARPQAAEDLHGFDRFAYYTGTDTWWPTGATNTWKPFAFMRNSGSGASGGATNPYNARWTTTTAWKPLSGPNVTAGTATCGGGMNASSCSDTMSGYTPGGVY